MKSEDFVRLIEDLTEKRIETHKERARDYANEDALSNFKRVSKAVEALRINPDTPWGCAVFEVIVKLDRIVNLTLLAVPPDNKTVRDSFIDAHNYLDLALACLIDDWEDVK